MEIEIEREREPPLYPGAGGRLSESDRVKVLYNKARDRLCLPSVPPT